MMADLSKKFWLFGWICVALVFAIAYRLLEAPLRTVVVQGHYEHVDGSRLKSVLDAYSQQPLVRLDLVQLTQDLKQLPWVAQVHLKRVWPGQLVVELQEPQPVLRWGHHALLDEQGEIYRVGQVGEYAALGLLQCDASRIPEGMLLYRRLQRLLAEKDLTLLALSADRHGLWSLWLDHDDKWVMGSASQMHRVRRFLNHGLPYLRKHHVPLAHSRIDLRYVDGFALSRYHQPRSGSHTHHHA